MALNWSTVRTEHVRRACELLSQTPRKPSARASGLFVLNGGQRLPAKQVVRLAYCIANNLDQDSKLKFSSGDGILNMLQRLGFTAERVGGPPIQGTPA